MDNIDVSIVIVCMNNLKNLYSCLDSIKEYTKISYEVLVVAYLFSPNNIKKARIDYPWVKFIESNEYRGFSENNNLALKQAKGKYCFVQNDDTYYQMPVVDLLVESLEKTPGCAIISPTSHFPDGRLQSCGRPRWTWWKYLLSLIKMYDEQNVKSEFTKRKGIFQTYNIVGAFFLIPTELFHSLGWFDEKYFFCPEDIALSTKANKMGLKVFVDANVDIIHVEGGTWSKTMVATGPASQKGELMFFANGSYIAYLLLGLFVFMVNIFKLVLSIQVYIYRRDEKSRVYLRCYWNKLISIFTRQTPKKLFIKYYTSIKSQ